MPRKCDLFHVSLAEGSPPCRRHTSTRFRVRRGFSFVEMVIVVVIIGIIAAIALPRIGGLTGNARTSAAGHDATTLQRAIDHYAAEHGVPPGADDIVGQLTGFTNVAGATSPTKTGSYVYGPYVKKIPALPDGPNRGAAGIAAAPAPGVGWIYDASTAQIRPNLNAAP